MPLLRNHMPKKNRHLRVRNILKDNLNYEVEVVESVCSVGRLGEVLNSSFSSIPVVNMAGKLIGILPKNFGIVLIEEHAWYKEEKKSDLELAYRTSKNRLDSQVLSMASHEELQNNLRKQSQVRDNSALERADLTEKEVS